MSFLSFYVHTIISFVPNITSYRSGYCLRMLRTRLPCALWATLISCRRYDVIIEWHHPFQCLGGCGKCLAWFDWEPQDSSRHTHRGVYGAKLFDINHTVHFNRKIVFCSNSRWCLSKKLIYVTHWRIISIYYLCSFCVCRYTGKAQEVTLSPRHMPSITGKFPLCKEHFQLTTISFS